jgi:hydroxylaminobenzene mutase
VAWGSEPFGQPTTPPSWLSNVVAISSETWHNLALRSDGTVVAWGNNNFGQTNVPAGLSNVLAIAAGYQHSLALERDGTLVAWGNPRYVTNVPPVLGQVAAISSGDYHSLALSPVNLPPRVFSRTATGPLNSDLIVTLAGWDPNGDVLGFRIASLPTNGTLYQYTGSGRGDPITSPDSSLTDPLKLVFSPSPDSFGAPYTTFSYVASDGQYDSPPGLVTVNILPPPVIGAAGFVPSGTPGFALNFDGLSNASYAVFLCGLGLNQSGKLESAEPSHSTLARPILLFGYRRDKSAFPVLSHHLTMNTPYPRLALGAHIQFVTNGILIVVMAVLLLTLPHQVGPKSSGVMLLAAWLTWTMALSEAANAWWGTTQMLPIAAGQAGATGGTAWHELVVKLTHIAAGVGLVAAWGLLVIGFLKRPTEAGGSNKQAQPLLHRDR